jgi:hypothetical protein
VWCVMSGGVNGSPQTWGLVVHRFASHTCRCGAREWAGRWACEGDEWVGRRGERGEGYLGRIRRATRGMQLALVACHAMRQRRKPVRLAGSRFCRSAHLTNRACHSSTAQDNDEKAHIQESKHYQRPGRAYMGRWYALKFRYAMRRSRTIVVVVSFSTSARAALTDSLASS